MIRCAPWLALLALLAPPAGASDAPLWSLGDPRGDDHGSGSIIYPMRDDMRPGDLDLLSLVATPEGDGTTFEATFANPIVSPAGKVIDAGGGTLGEIARLGFYAFNLDLYIDTDRVAGSGRVEMLPGRRAAIDSSCAWEKVVCLTPRPAIAEEQMRSRLIEIGRREGSGRRTPELRRAAADTLRARYFFPTRVRVSGRTVRFFVPTSFLGDRAREDWAYVAAVSGADITSTVDLVSLLGIDRDRTDPGLMILPVVPGRSTTAFGGAEEDDALQPPLIDIVVPAGRSQEEILSAYDSAAGRPARLPGVVPASETARSR
jgi:hypothetical protein